MAGLTRKQLARNGFLGCLVPLAIVGVAFGLRSCSPHWQSRDDKLIAEFAAKKPMLERLYKLASAQNGYWSADPDLDPHDMAEEAAYPDMRSAAVTVERSESGIVYFEARRIEVDWFQWLSKGYAYMQSPPKKLWQCLDDVKPAGFEAAEFRHLEGNWYLFITRRGRD